jgi:hypothetical protein
MLKGSSYVIRRAETGDIVINNVNNFGSESDDETLKRSKVRPKYTILDYAGLTLTELLIYDKRSSYNYFIDCLTIEHSIMGLIYKTSLKDPTFLRLLKLIFSINLQLGFNALLFTDYYIDRRQEIYSVLFLLT